MPEGPHSKNISIDHFRASATAKWNICILPQLANKAHNMRVMNEWMNEIGKDIVLVDNAPCPGLAAPQQQRRQALRKAFTLHHSTFSWVPCSEHFFPDARQPP